ncbi:uncharacterized protein LOC143187787 [Calliopsis andreniformis]|uniref:uncharacterized protein LOC143187787 n=1 Tax=Calliopsis andreniformis TaxID=337506 RepID=UPI003FCDAE86
MAGTSGYRVVEAERRVYVARLAPYTKKKDLMMVFGSWGAREAVVQRKATGNTAFVTSETAEQASRVVEEAGVHPFFCHKRKLGVLPADSWHSRGEDVPVREPAVDPFDGLILPPSKAAALPVECLAHIGAYLEYRDRARMEQVSHRWREGSLWSHQGVTAFDPNDWRWGNSWNCTWEKNPLSTEAFRWAILRGGRYITSLRLDDSRLVSALRPQALSIAAAHCGRLRDVDLLSVSIRPPVLRELKTLRGLESLTVGRCTGPVDPELKELLDNNTALQTLTLVGNSFTGSAIRDGIRVGTLRIRRCQRMRSECLASALASAERLAALEIGGCYQIVDAKPLDALIGNRQLQIFLTELIIHLVNFYPAPIIGDIDEPEVPILEPEVTRRAVALMDSFQNLRTLDVSFCRWVDGRVIAAVGRSLRSLERLNISGCMSLRGEDLEPLSNLSACRELQMDALFETVRGGFLSRMIALTTLTCRDNNSVTDDDICGLLRAAAQLGLLNLEGCQGIGNLTVGVASETVPVRGQILYMYLGGTRARPAKRQRATFYNRVYYERIGRPTYFQVDE